MSSTRLFAVASIFLGAAAIILPYFFGTAAVMVLGGVILANGAVALLYTYNARKHGFPVSVFGPWAQVTGGLIILVWPELTLWLLAILMGGGLIFGGIAGLTAMTDSKVVNPPPHLKIGLWTSIVLGVLLILLGGFGSAVLLGLILGIALINAGIQQWRAADLRLYRFP